MTHLLLSLRPPSPKLTELTFPPKMLKVPLPVVPVYPVLTPRCIHYPPLAPAFSMNGHLFGVEVAVPSLVMLLKWQKGTIPNFLPAP